MKWQSDVQMFELISSTLYTPVVGDVLDSLGYWHQFLPPEIQPLDIAMKLVGRAMPVQIADAWGFQKRPFGRLTEALDQIKPSEVYIATGGQINCAAWGEILTATARTRGGTGAIIDGYHRDTQRVMEQIWPVFSRGRYAQDAAVRSSVVDYRCTVQIGSVSVEPGELIFGDLDGVVIIPKTVEEEVVVRSLEKARAEKLVRKEIEAGAASTDVFAKFGIL
jgi:4-hydroxy-4-methyl-2-oxoglutarate aldolase